MRLNRLQGITSHMWVTFRIVVHMPSAFWTFTRMGCSHLSFGTRDFG